MNQIPYIIDALQYNNWSENIFRQMREGGLTAVNITICYHENFREGLVEKSYLALVVGDWLLGEYLVDERLLVNHRKNGERHVVISGAGKSAETLIGLSRSFGRYSLLLCHPLTGRTHQIRAHAKHVGYPIVGDKRYGNERDNAVAEKNGLKRIFLHAQSISFPDGGGNELHFVAPLPKDLQFFLDRTTDHKNKTAT